MSKQPGGSGETRDGGWTRPLRAEGEEGVEGRGGGRWESSNLSEEPPDHGANCVVSHRVLRGTTTQPTRVTELKAATGTPPIQKKPEVCEVDPRGGPSPQPSKVAMSTLKTVTRKERHRPMIKTPTKMHQRVVGVDLVVPKQGVASTLPGTLRADRWV